MSLGWFLVLLGLYAGAHVGLRLALSPVVAIDDAREALFSQTLQAKLKAGDYEITCGLLNSPRGILHVTPSAESDAEAARPAHRSAHPRHP